MLTFVHTSTTFCRFVVWIAMMVCLASLCPRVVVGQITSIAANSNNIGSLDNTAIGIEALSAISKQGNVGIGFHAGRLLNSGEFNTVAGNFALSNASSASIMSLMGYGAGAGLNENFSGWCAFGYMTLRELRYGEFMNACGANALRNATGTVSNVLQGVAVGANALFSNTNGNDNLAFGASALFFNTTGSNNLGAGSEALYRNTTGNQNVAVGYRAMEQNLNGSRNVVMGGHALGENLSGNNNVAFGTKAGFHSLGSGNVFYGYEAGYHETGSNKLYIGNRRDQTLIYGDFTTRQILLGVRNPVNYQFKGNRTLNVVGGILTDSVRVLPVVNWPDYVFAEDYSLMPLSELEPFVRTFRHLPGVPTAAEVAANGLELASFTGTLLEKIEELTLYTLAQHHALKARQDSIQAAERTLSRKTELIELLKEHLFRLTAEREKQSADAAAAKLPR